MQGLLGVTKGCYRTGCSQQLVQRRVEAVAGLILSFREEVRMIEEMVQREEMAFKVLAEFESTKPVVYGPVKFEVRPDDVGPLVLSEETAEALREQWMKGGFKP